MPPKRHFYQKDDFEVVEPPKVEETKVETPIDPHSSDDSEFCLINRDEGCYLAEYSDFILELELIALEFQKISEDFTGEPFHGTKEEKIAHFDKRIGDAKKSVAKVQRKEEDIRYLLNVNPLKLAGVLFDSDFLKNAKKSRTLMNEIFSDEDIVSLREEFNDLIKKKIKDLIQDCENQVRLENETAPETSGAMVCGPITRDTDDEIDPEEMDG